MMMSTFSSLTVLEGQKEEISVMNGEIIKFNYPEVLAYHYIYGGSGK